MLSRAVNIPELLGSSPPVVRIRESFEQLAGGRTPILLVGEQGTGKEETARALHRHAGGTLRAFVVADVSETAPAEIEGLLFGESAAFMRANAGTVYFDEIGVLIPALQAKLLRVLQEGEFYPVGHNKPVKTGARIMAATTQDLKTRASAGLFNQRLLEALSANRMILPPLRHRRSDIPGLIKHYLALEAKELSIMAKSMTEAAVQKLVELDWPGNLPQLESVCRRTTAFTDGRLIDVDDLPDDLWSKPQKRSDGWSGALDKWARRALDEGQVGILDIAVPELERVMIRAALDKSGGQRQEAARLLGWGRNTLTRKIKDLEIDAD